MSIANTVKNSFLNRVPDLMAADPELSLEDAIKKAYEIEETFCIKLQVAADKVGNSRRHDPYCEAIDMLSEQVYQKLRSI